MIYKFFGYLELVISSNNRSGYDNYFNNEYLRISSKQPICEESARVSVEIVSRLPELQTGDIRRTVRFKQLFTFHYLVRNIASKQVTVFFQSHLLDKFYMNAIAVFLQAQVLEPIMYLKLLEMNVLFMHAGGVANDDEGYLLPAYGGTGKTTFSMALLNSGYRLLGDDLLFVALDEGKVYPYPRPMHIFTYNVNSLVGAKIPLAYKAKIYLKNMARLVLEGVLKTEFLISTRIHADEVFPESPFGQAVPYKRIFFLKKEGARIQPQAITNDNRSELATEIMQSADLNDSLYQILDNESAIADVKCLEMKVIESLLSQFDSLSYINTRKLDLNNLQPFISENF